MAICAPIGRIMSVKKMSNYSAHNSNSVPTQRKQKDGELQTRRVYGKMHG
jgi:hypothetical protein